MISPETPLDLEEALSLEQVIRFYTWNNAYLVKLEDKVRSLEPGMRADLIIIDRDLLTCPVEDVKETKVVATCIDGKQGYSSAP